MSEQPPPTDPVVRLVDVCRHYRLGGGLVKALDGVTLDIAAGDMVACAGPSGSGKSTLLNLMGAMDRPTSGELVLLGQPISAMDERALTDFRRAHLGFIFQAFNLIAVLDAAENVAFPLEFKGMAPSRARLLALDALAQVGMADQARQRPNQLSGGQQQRVAIARALVGKPRVILADEPTANLDSQTGEQIIALLGQLNAAHGVTLVFATHDPRIIAGARTVLHVRDGRIEPT